MSLSCSTALLRHPRILLRDSTIDRPTSPLPDQIAALRPHLCRVHRSGGYILVAFPAIGHLRPFIVKVISPLQNDVRRLRSVRRFWIRLGILPDIHLQKALAFQLCGQLSLVHGTILYPLVSFNAGLAIFVQKRQRPFRSDGGCREKGVPSSGEKIVITKSVVKDQSSPGGGAWLRPTLGIPW